MTDALRFLVATRVSSIRTDKTPSTQSANPGEPRSASVTRTTSAESSEVSAERELPTTTTRSVELTSDGEDVPPSRRNATRLVTKLLSLPVMMIQRILLVESLLDVMPLLTKTTVTVLELLHQRPTVKDKEVLSRDS